MSFANGTTYYNLPQTVGTDKRDWFDTNTPFANVDADLHEAVTKARESATDITTLAGRVSNVETAQSTQAQDIVDIKATQETQGTAITSLGNKIDDVEDDCLDMICAVDEGTAQVATVAVTTGHYFRYNNVLYMATADIAIGDTIIPNTNCRATNVATELEAGVTPSAPTAAEVSYDNTSTGMTADDVQEAIDEIHTNIVSANFAHIVGCVVGGKVCTAGTAIDLGTLTSITNGVVTASTAVFGFALKIAQGDQTIDAGMGLYTINDHVYAKPTVTQTTDLYFSILY